ncbi:mCG145659, partial [Mus musculus]
GENNCGKESPSLQHSSSCAGLCSFPRSLLFCAAAALESPLLPDAVTLTHGWPFNGIPGKITPGETTDGEWKRVWKGDNPLPQDPHNTPIPAGSRQQALASYFPFFYHEDLTQDQQEITTLKDLTTTPHPHLCSQL